MYSILLSLMKILGESSFEARRKGRDEVLVYGENIFLGRDDELYCFLGGGGGVGDWQCLSARKLPRG